MIYCLDTNTCIYFLNGKFETIKNKILSTPPNEIAIPAIVKAELLLGAYKSRNREATVARVEKFLSPFRVLAFEDAMTYVYADIRYKTEKAGNPIGPNDLVIAAIVKFNNGILVTNNTREFALIPGLQVENWAN